MAGLADQHSGLEVADWSAAAAAFSETERTGAWVNYLLVGMIVGYAVISLVNTLIVATAERRREFAVQRLIGSTRSQVMRMMIMEASFVTLAGIMLGGVVAVATLAPFNIAPDRHPGTSRSVVDPSHRDRVRHVADVHRDARSGLDRAPAAPDRRAGRIRLNNVVSLVPSRCAPVEPAAQTADGRLARCANGRMPWADA